MTVLGATSAAPPSRLDRGPDSVGTPPGARRPTPTPLDRVLRYWTRTRLVWAVVWSGLVLRGWVIASGWFYWDDYTLQARAWRLPMDTEYLLHDQDGHLMPGALALQWVMTRLFPMNFAALALVLLVLQAAALAVFARLLLREFGNSRLVLVPAVIVCFTPLTMPGSSWWASALNLLPLQIAMTVAVAAHLRWLRRGRRHDAAIAMIAWLIGLLFFEKAVLIPFFLLGVAWVVDTSHDWRHALLRPLRRHPVVWGSYAVLVVTYLIALRLVSGNGLQTPYDWAAAAEFLSRGVTGGLLPALVGGPWTWEPVGFGTALADPPTLLVLVTVQAAIVLVVLTGWLSRRARRAWVLAAVYLAAGLGLTVATRLTAGVDPSVVMGLRFLADAVVPIAVAVALALVPLRRERHAARALRVRAWLVARRSWTAPIAAAAVLVVVVGSVVSASSFQAIWRANPSRAIIEQVTADLAQRPLDVPVLDQPVPDQVLDGLSYPYNLASWTLAPIRNRPSFETQTSDLTSIDDTGAIVPALVDGTDALPGPIDACGWRAGPGSTYIALAEDVPPFQYTVRIGYLASADATVEVSFQSPGAPVYTVPIKRGLHPVFLTMDGGGRFLKITAPSDRATLCTDDVVVGEVVPIPEEWLEQAP